VNQLAKAHKGDAEWIPDTIGLHLSENSESKLYEFIWGEGVGGGGVTGWSG